jgi:hypothetical protein
LFSFFPSLETFDHYLFFLSLFSTNTFLWRNVRKWKIEGEMSSKKREIERKKERSRTGEEGRKRSTEEQNNGKK